MKVKVLHCADIHLDSAFSLEDAAKAEIRRSELRGTFTSLMSYAKMNEVDLVLMAGDLFDREFVTKDTVSLMIKEFAANPDCRFVISPGNHDPYTATSVYAKTEFPENVFIFDKSELSFFDFEKLGVTVYGYAFTSQTMETNPIAGERIAKDPGKINLLCAHGDLLSPISPYCPITKSDIRISGVDYAAIGHVHNSFGVEREGDSYYGYSGCLEGRDFGETGYKGAIYAEFEKIDGKTEAKFWNMKFSKRRYESIDVDITGAVDISAALSAVKSEVVGKYGEDTSLRVALVGNIPAGADYAAPIEKMLSELVFYAEVRDNTLPLYQTDALKADPSIRGAFFRSLLPVLEEGTPEERKSASEALRIGLAALDGRDLTQI